MNSWRATASSALVALGFGFLALPSPASAQARWAPGAVIKVWIGTSAERSDDPKFVELAMATWTRAAAGKFTFERVSDQRNANVRVAFVDGNRNLGEASPVTAFGTGYIVSGDVAIANNLVATPLEQRVIIYMTALHELGHILGLRHTAEFDDIMYFFTRPGDAERYFVGYAAKVKEQKNIGSKEFPGLSPHDLDVFAAIYR